MASKDLLKSAEIHVVYISEARCNSLFLRTSKLYRLHFTIQPPATVTGLRSPKSDYIKATHGGVTWKDPFGDEFTVIPATINCRVTIDLHERRFGRSARILASCNLDLSSGADKETRLDLNDGRNNKFGELTICVAPSRLSTREALQSASKAAERLDPGLPAVNDAKQAIAPLPTEITAQLDAWQPLLNRLVALVKVADALDEIHPWIKLAWGVVSVAYKIHAVQSDRDAKVMNLVQTMADSCSFADEGEELKKRSQRDQDIINQILRQVMECAYFIRDYCVDKAFVKRTVKNVASLVDTQIDAYKGTLETLRRNLIDNANIPCAVIAHRVLDVVNEDEVRDLQVLSELEYASNAHHDLNQGCLPGTRTKIIDAIVHWALGADIPPSDSSGSTTSRSNDDHVLMSSSDSSGSTTLRSNDSRVLWLCGTAGAGKTSILRSCETRISDLGRKGSYYGFDKYQRRGNLTNLFSTIARDLADLDNSRKQRLIDAVKKDTAIQTTDDCKLQFEHFIIEPFKDDKAVGRTIVFIDGFDESEDGMARADALAVLTKRASELPPGLRVIIASRFERDIQDAVRDVLMSPLPPGIDIFLLDNIPNDETLRDIATYIHTELDRVGGLREAEYQTQVDALIRKAGTSFQWAATACRFIRSHSNTGVDPRDQIGMVLGADEGLYALYSAVMKRHCDPSHEMEVKRIKSILGRIICAQEPLSLHALVHLVPPGSILTPDDMRTQRQIVNHLASLLSGTQSDHEPIVPLHASYRDFLRNPEHNKDFYIDEGEANQDMALACFRVMEQNLTFNICQLPTSFLRNVDIPNIKGLVEKHIPSHLSYACQFWGFHASITPSSKATQKCMKSFFQKDFLPWLEVMSLTQSSPQSALALLRTSHMAADLVELRYDALQFISMFAPAIMTSTSHIYLSGLTFAPASSLLYERSQDQFPGVAKLSQGQLQHWPKIMLILEGHHEAVLSVAFSPDGKQIASGSSDKTIQLWNAETGASVGLPMEGHNRAVCSIAFSPDGKIIASGSSDKTIQLWSVETGVSIGWPMVGHSQGVFSIAFSPDGKQIASGSSDRTIQVWNVETGVRIGQPMKRQHLAILSIAFSPDGKLIASGSEDSTILLWNVETGAYIGLPMEGHDSGIPSIVFSPDGKQIASGSRDNTIQLWNVETGGSIGQPMQGHDDAVLSVAFSPDGKQIASGSRDNTIRLWDVEIGVSIGQPLEGHDDAVLSVAFSPDGKQIASGSRDNTIRLWNVETGVSIGQPMEGHDGSILPDSKWIISDPKDNSPKISQSPTMESKYTLQYPVYLFPLPPAPFHVDDGWILGPSDELILWVPPAYRASIEHPHSHTVGNPNSTQIDFQHFKCGNEWAQCHLVK